MEEADLYPIAQENAENILSEIQATYNVKRSEIRWLDFCHLLGNKYDVIIEPKQFDNIILAQRFAGELVIGKRKSIISYNNGMFQNDGRQRFTIVHEGIHYMRHKADHMNGEHYSEILTNGSYSPEEEQEELLTNQTASIIMLNDEALERCMRNNKRCYDISSLYGMSGKAVFYRMLNYLKFNLKIVPDVASYLAGRYCYGSTEAACTFLCFFINNFDDIMEWVKNGYHAFVHWLEFCSEIGYTNVPSSYWYQINHLLPDSVLC